MTTFVRPPEWMDKALCAQTDPEAFFPDKGGSTAAAKRICLMCEVRTECLTYALNHHERFGIWGGLAERERRQLEPKSKERVCVACSQAFIPENPSAHPKYCSDDCAHDARLAQQREYDAGRRATAA